VIFLLPISFGWVGLYLLHLGSYECITQQCFIILSQPNLSYISVCQMQNYIGYLIGKRQLIELYNVLNDKAKYYIHIV